MLVFNSARKRYFLKLVSKFDSSVNSWITSSLTDEQLAKVSKLNINPLLSPGTDVTSLAGIEKLPNLEHLSIQGMSPVEYFAKIDAIKKKEKSFFKS